MILVYVLAIAGLAVLLTLAILGVLLAATWPDRESKDDPFEAAAAAATRLQDHAYRAVEELQALDRGRKGDRYVRTERFHPSRTRARSGSRCGNGPPPPRRAARARGPVTVVCGTRRRRRAGNRRGSGLASRGACINGPPHRHDRRPGGPGDRLAGGHGPRSGRAACTHLAARPARGRPAALAVASTVVSEPSNANRLLGRLFLVRMRTTLEGWFVNVPTHPNHDDPFISSHSRTPRSA